MKYAAFDKLGYPISVGDFVYVDLIGECQVLKGLPNMQVRVRITEDYNKDCVVPFPVLGSACVKMVK